MESKLEEFLKLYPSRDSIYGINIADNRKRILFYSALKYLRHEAELINMSQINPYKSLYDEHAEACIQALIERDDVRPYMYTLSIGDYPFGRDLFGLYCLSKKDKDVRNKFVSLLVNKSVFDKGFAKGTINLIEKKIDIRNAAYVITQKEKHINADSFKKMEILGLIALYIDLMEFEEPPVMTYEDHDKEDCQEYLYCNTFNYLVDCDIEYAKMMNGKEPTIDGPKDVDFDRWYEVFYFKTAVDDDLDRIAELSQRIADSPFTHFMIKDVCGTAYDYYENDEDYIRLALGLISFNIKVLEKACPNEKFVFNKFNLPFLYSRMIENMNAKQEHMEHIALMLYNDLSVATSNIKNMDATKKKCDEAEAKCKEAQAESERLKEKMEKLEQQSVFDRKSDKQRINELNHDKEKLNQRIAELEKANSDQMSELKALRTFAYNLDIDTPKEEAVSDIRSLVKDMRVLCIGGHDNLLSKVHKEFPKWNLLDSKRMSFDKNLIKNAELVIIFNRYISHSPYYFAVDTIREYDIPLLYSAANNIERLLGDIGTYLEEL